MTLPPSGPPFWGFPIAAIAMFHSKRARVYFNKPFSRATNSSMPLKGKHRLVQIALPNTEVLDFPNTREKNTGKMFFNFSEFYFRRQFGQENDPHIGAYEDDSKATTP